MCFVISVLNQKGGSGKTTLATNLARAIQLKNYKVLLVDSDPQGSARDWNEANEGEIVSVVGLDRETLPKDLKAISSGYHFIVVDGAPQIAKLSAAGVKAANLILIPVQPSPYDVWACADLVDLVKSRQAIDSALKAAFVITRAIRNTKLANDVTKALANYELPIIGTCTFQRVAYATTAAKGLTVFDVEDSTTVLAKDEMGKICNEVLEISKNLNKCELI